MSSLSRRITKRSLLVIKGLQTLAGSRYSFRECNPDRIVLVIANDSLRWPAVESISDQGNRCKVAILGLFEQYCGNSVELLRITPSLVDGRLADHSYSPK
jgi:hypothetical protein